MIPRRIVAAAVGASALCVGLPAAAHADKASPELKRMYLHAYKQADRHGEPGRNIVRQGVRHAGGRHTPSEEKIQASLAVLRGMSAPAPSPAAAPAAGPTAAAAPSAAASPALNSIAACESGGDPGAVDASGTYRGKYQFDQQTWASVGGSGDPAAAPEAEQDARAQQLLSQSGSSPWPVCGG